ncbi:LPS-assembly protein LptD [Aliidiomarina sedimenti]|uniref:LPS-assembly protein LptD n=1 Tax=Aliidiomarina sedimenti TaxID=1933879 RepID=UPI0013003497|nr:LPS assembly protein LptD [Aliidiomarina sedimenti]
MAAPVQANSNPPSLTEQCSAPPEWLPDPVTHVGEGVNPVLHNAVMKNAVINTGMDASVRADGSERLEVNADEFDMRRNNQASFSGNVEIRHLNQYIQTEQAQFNQAEGSLSATGGLVYTDGYVAVRGESIEANTRAQTASIHQLDYYLVGTSARGAARGLHITNVDNTRSLNFNRSSFTTCPGDRPPWEIRARSIEMNEGEGWGRARGAQVRLFNIPVLYVPSFSFPLTDERKSGFLHPTITSSGRNGIELAQPYYFSLAPNYDATITPRYMSQRGIMGMAEGRYMDQRQLAQVNLEFLDQDNDRQDEGSRSYWRVEHLAHISDNWSTYIDASSVSDVNYFNDFGSDFANRADSHIYRRGQADYSNNRWQGQLQIEDFQLLGPYQSAFRTLPRLSVDYDTGQPVRQGLRLDWQNELTHFERQSGSPEKASRFHTETGVSYLMRRPGWEWSSEGRMLLTHYEQTLIENGELVDRSITRALPELRLHGQLNFERPFSFSDQTGIQTLQPQVQFLYTPYRDQRNIGVYDSVPLQDDYNGLFRKRRFSGLDRIADANQVTVGATTSIFNQSAEELMRFSIGQIFYFDDSETQLFDNSTQITDTSSELAAEVDFRISSRWFFSASAQYDSELNQMQKSRSAVEYRKDNSNLIQLNFRQVRGLIGTETDVEQVGMLGSWQLRSQWSVAGHYYRDLGNSRTLDANFGVQYESCCWAVRLSAYRRIDRNFEGIQSQQSLSPAEFDNGLSLQFVITGLSSDRSSLAGMLQQGIFGYRRPFYLSD